MTNDIEEFEPSSEAQPDEKHRKRIRRRAKRQSFGWAVLFGGIFTFFSPLFIGEMTRDRPTIWIAMGAVMLLTTWAAYRIVLRRKSRKLTCKDCGTAFAIELADRDARLISAVPRQRKTLAGYRGTDMKTPYYSHESWVDEKYDTLDTYACVACGTARTVRWTQTKRSGYQSSKDY